MLKKLVKFFVENPIIINVLLVMILFTSIFIGISMKKESFPRVISNQVVVFASYPGASSRVVEIEVTKIIEDVLQGVSGIDEMKSQSFTGRSFIRIELDTFDKEEQREILQTIRDRVSQTLSLLPDGATTPTVELQEVVDFPTSQLHLGYENTNEVEMVSLLNVLEAELESVPGVSDAMVAGNRDKEIQILIDMKKLQEYDISITDIQHAIQAYTVSASGGEIRQDNGNYQIEILSELKTIEDIRAIRIRQNFSGYGVSLGTVAEVKEGLADNEIFFVTNGKQGFLISILSDDDADELALMKQVNKIVHRYQKLLSIRYSTWKKNLAPTQAQQIETFSQDPLSFFVRDFAIQRLSKVSPPQVQLTQLYDASQDTKNILLITVNSIMIGIVLVFLTLLLFLDFRTAWWTALGIPISLAMVIIVVSFVGYSINRMLLFGVITVIGILVDDGIVVAENIYRLKKKGHTEMEAAVEGSISLFRPLLGTVLTTIFAFAPMLLIQDANFKLIEQMPGVIMIALSISLLEVMFSLPVHLTKHKRFFDIENVLESRSQHKIKEKKIDKFFTRLEASYQRFLFKTLPYRYVTFFIFLGILMFSLSVFKSLPTILFSSNENEYIGARLFSPNTNTLEQNKQYALALERRVRQEVSALVEEKAQEYGVEPQDPIRAIFMNVGTLDTLASPTSNQSNNVVSMTIALVPYYQRFVKSEEITKRLTDHMKNPYPFSLWIQDPFVQQDPVIQDFIKEPKYKKFKELYQAFKVIDQASSGSWRRGLRFLARPQNQEHQAGKNDPLSIGFEAWKQNYLQSSLPFQKDIDLKEVYMDYIQSRIRFFEGFTNIRFIDYGTASNSSSDQGSSFFSLKVEHQNDETRDLIAQNIKNFLAQTKGILSAEIRDENTKDVLRLDMSRSQMERLGTSPQQIARGVSVGFQGTQVGTIETPTDTIAVRMRLKDEDRYSLKSLDEILVETNYQRSIPLKSLAKPYLDKVNNMVKHEGGKRLAEIDAMVDPESGVSLEVLNRIIQQQIPHWLSENPDARIRVTGTFADSQSTQSLSTNAFVIGVLLIALTLIFIFKSVSQPILILLIIPFGIMGVSFAFALHGLPLSFFAFVGIIGLSGVVVNDAIVMMDVINNTKSHHLEIPDKQERKKELYRYVSTGASFRLKAILLTTLTTVAGLLPTAYGIGTGRLGSVLQPLGIALSYGLTVATFVTLFLLPSMYIIHQDLLRLFMRIFYFPKFLIQKIRNKTN